MTERGRDGTDVSGIAATIAEVPPSTPGNGPAIAPPAGPGTPDSFAATIAPGTPDSFAPTIAPSSPEAFGSRAAPGPASIARTIAVPPSENGGPAPAPETHRDTPTARKSAPSIRPPQRPSVKDNRYALGTEIARGGMGRVVEATDHLLGRTVAIKEALIADEDLRLRFMRETRITARLEHPSIVPVYDAGTLPDGSPFYVMRRVSGRPLEDLVYRAETLDQRLALLPNLLAAANAIAHAHSRGIVHRDIKPSNILVGEHGETVVIDWGLAKVVDEPDEPAPPQRDSLRDADVSDLVHTRVGSVVGTPGFMPPEQLRGEHVDARSDVYALGATLYFLLARRPPHAAKTGQEMMTAALAGPPTPVRDLVSGVAPELLTIVDKALAYTHDARYQDAGGLAADLDRFLKGQLVASHRYSRRERLIRFWRRHRLALSIAAVAVVAIAAGSWLAIARIVEARNRADAALAETLEHNESLQLARARDVLHKSPADALALVKPLAAKHWRDARAIALAARAVGVAYRLPGSPSTLSLVLSRDGTRALAAGDDGVVRVHELVSRTTRELARFGSPTRAAFGDGDRSVVAWGGGTLRVIDVVSGTAREQAFAGDPVVLRVDGTQLWWIDRDGAAWTGALDGSAPQRLAIDDRLFWLEVHDGVAAIMGERALWRVRDGRPSSIVTGMGVDIAWSASGALGALVDVPAPAQPRGAVRVRVELDRDATTQRTVPVDSRAQSVAWVGSTLYVGGNASVTRADTGRAVRWQGDIVRLRPSGNNALVATNSSQGIAVMDDNVLVEIPPTSVVGEIATSPATRHLVVGSDGALLVWNLEHIMPSARMLGLGHVGHSVRHDQLVIAHEDYTLTWIDMRTGVESKHRIPGRLSNVGFTPDGSRIVVCEVDGRGTVYARNPAATIPLTLPCRMARFVGRDQVVVGASSGELHLIDLRTGTSRLLTTGTSPPWDILVRGDWIAVLRDDNSLYRINVTSGAVAEMPRGRDRWMELLDSGDALLSNQGVYTRWRTDGSLVDGAALPYPTYKLVLVGDEQLFVIARGDTGHLVDLVSGKARQVFPAGSRLHDIRFTGELGAFIDQLDQIHATMVDTGFTWTLARGANQPLRAPLVSDDGTHIYAVSGGTVLTWTLPRVRTREATLALIDELTR